MAVEDLAALRAIHGTTVLYPSDGNATVALVATMADLRGISYLRTTREATAVLYGPDEDFPIGASKTLREGDVVTLIGAGITVHESLRAADRLAEDGIAARVIDCYSVKPIDAATLRRAAAETGLLVVIEDHRIEGGLGDAVLDALAGETPPTARVIKRALTEMPGSGAPEELRAWAGIDSDAIVRTVRRALDRG
jgi:transketolase